MFIQFFIKNMDVKVNLPLKFFFINYKIKAGKSNFLEVEEYLINLKEPQNFHLCIINNDFFILLNEKSNINCFQK